MEEGEEPEEAEDSDTSDSDEDVDDDNEIVNNRRVLTRKRKRITGRHPKAPADYSESEESSDDFQPAIKRIKQDHGTIQIRPQANLQQKFWKHVPNSHECNIVCLLLATICRCIYCQSGKHGSLSHRLCVSSSTFIFTSRRPSVVAILLTFSIMLYKNTL